MGPLTNDQAVSRFQSALKGSHEIKKSDIGDAGSYLSAETLEKLKAAGIKFADMVASGDKIDSSELKTLIGALTKKVKAPLPKKTEASKTRSTYLGTALYKNKAIEVNDLALKSLTDKDISPEQAKKLVMTFKFMGLHILDIKKIAEQIKEMKPDQVKALVSEFEGEISGIRGFFDGNKQDLNRVLNKFRVMAGKNPEKANAEISTSFLKDFFGSDYYFSLSKTKYSDAQKIYIQADLTVLNNGRGSGAIMKPTNDDFKKAASEFAKQISSEDFTYHFSTDGEKLPDNFDGMSVKEFVAKYVPADIRGNQKMIGKDQDKMIMEKLIHDLKIKRFIDDDHESDLKNYSIFTEFFKDTWSDIKYGSGKTLDEQAIDIVKAACKALKKYKVTAKEYPHILTLDPSEYAAKFADKKSEPKKYEALKTRAEAIQDEIRKSKTAIVDRDQRELDEDTGTVGSWSTVNSTKVDGKTPNEFIKEMDSTQLSNLAKRLSEVRNNFAEFKKVDDLIVGPRRLQDQLQDFALWKVSGGQSEGGDYKTFNPAVEAEQVMAIYKQMTASSSVSDTSLNAAIAEKNAGDYVDPNTQVTLGNK